MRNVVGQVVQGEDFFDRISETEELWRRLGTGHVLMLAPRRVGKSSLMLHLKQAPRDGYWVHLVDLQGVTAPEMMLSKILVELAGDPAVGGAIRRSMGRLEKWLGRVTEVNLAGISVELAQEMGGNWRDVGEELFRALVREDGKTLIVLDEFPLMISHILKHQDKGLAVVSELLGWFRELRQAPQLAAGGKLRFLVGGSIGLDGILHRHGLIGMINDFDPFRLGPFDRATATEFLRGLTRSEGTPLAEEIVQAILERLGYLIPFHIQFFVSRLMTACRLRKVEPSLELLGEVYSENLLGPESLQAMGHYDARLSSALDAEEAKLAKRLLTECCRTVQGLSRQAAERVTAEALGREAPDLLRQVLNVLQHDGYLRYLPPSQASVNGTYAFWSGLLRDWWFRQYCG